MWDEREGTIDGRVVETNERISMFVDIKFRQDNANMGEKERWSRRELTMSTSLI